jgi:hypothetical protein
MESKLLVADVVNVGAAAALLGYGEREKRVPQSNGSNRHASQFASRDCKLSMMTTNQLNSSRECMERCNEIVLWLHETID